MPNKEIKKVQVTESKLVDLINTIVEKTIAETLGWSKKQKLNRNV